MCNKARSEVRSFVIFVEKEGVGKELNRMEGETRGCSVPDSLQYSSKQSYSLLDESSMVLELLRL